MNTKLQLALDDISLENAEKLVQEIQTYIDIVEIGTPFMMEYGMEAVRRLRNAFPQLEILCDGKIMDAGGYEAELAFKAGADYVTVLGVTDILTIKDVVTVSRKYGKKTMVDMICIPDMKERIRQVEELGVDVIAVHTGVDQQAAGRTPLDDLREMRESAKSAKIAVAGGINPSTVSEYMQYQPDIIIVGGGIVGAKDPVAAARELADQIGGLQHER